jgi:hypothetical protein
MCPKIRCDGKSKKFCKNSWELNRAFVCVNIAHCFFFGRMLAVVRHFGLAREKSKSPRWTPPHLTRQVCWPDDSSTKGCFFCHCFSWSLLSTQYLILYFQLVKQIKHNILHPLLILKLLIWSPTSSKLLSPVD